MLTISHECTLNIVKINFILVERPTDDLNDSVD